MKKRVVDLSDNELTSVFRAATVNASLEAAQCGLTVSGSVQLKEKDGLLFTTPALKLPSGEIQIGSKSMTSGKKRAKAA